MELSSGCLVLVRTAHYGYSLAGTLYIDVDGVRQSLVVDVHERPSEIELSVYSHLELLCSGVITQVQNKIKKGQFEPAPRPVEL